MKERAYNRTVVCPQAGSVRVFVHPLRLLKGWGPARQLYLKGWGPARQLYLKGWGPARQLLHVGGKR